jgi:hypothetical protein
MSVDPAVFLCGEKIMRQPSSRVLGTSEKYEILRDGNVVATENGSPLANGIIKFPAHVTVKPGDSLIEKYSRQAFEVTAVRPQLGPNTVHWIEASCHKK